MYSMPCLFGRTQVASLAAMNLRAVVGAGEITYVTRPPAKPAAITRLLGAKFQPRDEHGRFVTYADFRAVHGLGVLLDRLRVRRRRRSSHRR